MAIDGHTPPARQTSHEWIARLARLVGVALDNVLREATALGNALDAVVDAAGLDPHRQARADWAWYRFVTANVLVRDRGAGPVAAALARGLLEQAAYWDFGLANGDGEAAMAAWAATEYEGLRRLAQDLDDTTWLGWLLPPGEILTSPEGLIPRNSGDAVQRIGGGFAATVLEPLRYGGLLQANRILDALTHGNLAAALVMAPGGGDRLPEPLAAAVVHVAAASAVATATAQLGTHDVTTAGLVDLATRVAAAARPASLRSRAACGSSTDATPLAPHHRLERFVRNVRARRLRFFRRGRSGPRWFRCEEVGHRGAECRHRTARPRPPGLHDAHLPTPAARHERRGRYPLRRSDRQRRPVDVDRVRARELACQCTSRRRTR